MLQSPRFVSRFTVTLLLLLCSSALAFDGLTVGVNAHPAEGDLLDAHVIVPMFSVEGVQHSARMDATYAFAGLPSASLTYVFSAKPEGSVERYLGAGAGATFSQAPLSPVVFSAHALAGMRVPLFAGLHTITEVSVAGNGLDSGIGLALGLEYSFGGRK